MTELEILEGIISKLRDRPLGIFWKDLMINKDHQKVLDAFYGYHWIMKEGQENIILIDGELRDPVEIPYIEVDEIINF